MVWLSSRANIDNGFEASFLIKCCYLIHFVVVFVEANHVLFIQQTIGNLRFDGVTLEVRYV